jgi:hypothetical protein
MLTKSKQLLIDLMSLRKAIKAETSKRISKLTIRQLAESISQKWFSEFSTVLIDNKQISKELLANLNCHFERLLKLSSPNNLKTSYIDTLELIIKPFRESIVLKLQTNPDSSPTSLSLLNKLLIDITIPIENEYMKEAIGCAQRGFLRAAVILAWCAAIDRIHRKIEEIGFATFNITSSKMASDTKGRFKKFNQVQNINSVSELREVFDNIILWILEGMILIDTNQHTRLKGCFDMRCQSAHPGDAPITEWNLLSYFSDINEIIFKNSKFNLKNGGGGK